jgi:hypothetical protein
MKLLNHSLKEGHSFNLSYALKHKMLVKANVDDIKEAELKQEFISDLKNNTND